MFWFDRPSALFILLLCRFGLAQSAAPVDVQGTLNKGVCNIPLSYQGHVMKFRIDTGNPRSSLKFSDAQELLAQLGNAAAIKTETLQPLSIPIRSIAPDNSGFLRYKQSFDGILGFNILKTRAFGIDYQTGLVRFWPGPVSASDAMNWVRAGTTDKPVVGLQLDADKGDGFFTSTSFGSAVVDTGLSYSCFPMSANANTTASLRGFHEVMVTARGLSVDGAAHIARVLTVGGLSLPFRSFMNDPTATAAGIAPQVFGSHRVVFDYPDHAIYLSKPDSESMVAVMFADLTDASARAQGNVVSLPDPDHPGAYLPVETFAGISVSDFIKAVESGDDSALKSFSDLYDSYFNGCDIVLRDQGGPKSIHVKSGWPK